MPILFLSFSPTSFLRYPHVAFSHNIINSKTNHLMLCLSCYLSPMYKIQLIPIDTLSSDHNIFISSFISFCLCLTVPPLYLVLFNSTAFAIFSSIYFNPLNLLLLSHLFTSFLFKCTPPLFKITFFPFFFCYFNFSPTTIFFYLPLHLPIQLPLHLSSFYQLFTESSTFPNGDANCGGSTIPAALHPADDEWLVGHQHSALPGMEY